MMLCGIVRFVGFTVLLLSLKPMPCPGFDWLNMCFLWKTTIVLKDEASIWSFFLETK